MSACDSAQYGLIPALKVKDIVLRPDGSGQFIGGNGVLCCGPISPQVVEPDILAVSRLLLKSLWHPGKRVSC